jgi:hypothetical protein
MERIAVRALPERGTQVRFDATGQNVATLPRQGTAHQTSFAYTSGMLSSISLPKPSWAPAVTYTFAYVSNKLRTVTAPPLDATSRIATITVNSSNGQLESIPDTDTRIVRFGYDAGAYQECGERLDRVDAWRCPLSRVGDGEPSPHRVPRRATYTARGNLATHKGIASGWADSARTARARPLVRDVVRLSSVLSFVAGGERL